MYYSMWWLKFDNLGHFLRNSVCLQDFINHQMFTLARHGWISLRICREWQVWKKCFSTTDRFYKLIWLIKLIWRALSSQSAAQVPDIVCRHGRNRFSLERNGAKRNFKNYFAILLYWAKLYKPNFAPLSELQKWATLNDIEQHWTKFALFSC